jgi:hypothetical protein
MKAMGWCAVLVASGAAAQTVTGGGTANYVSKFSGSTTLVNSAITEDNGSVAVWGNNLGTTAGNTLGLLSLNSSDGSANNNSLNFTAIRNANGSNWSTVTVRLQEITDVTAQGYMDFNPVGGSYGLAFGSLGAEFVRISGSGNFGIGTTSPGAKLEVNGNVMLTNGSGASLTFADGTIQSTAWNGTLCGGDYAETVNASGDHKKYEPGDVLVLSSDNDSDVSKSSQPYSTLVSGIYSTKAGVIGRRQTGEKRDSEIPMAMVGIVPTKVSAENGSIRRGDLLVTSSTEGYAMKGTDPSRMLGAIVGKAMGSLDSGSGVIEVLVSLQ